MSSDFTCLRIVCWQLRDLATGHKKEAERESRKSAAELLELKLNSRTHHKAAEGYIPCVRVASCYL